MADITKEFFNSDIIQRGIKEKLISFDSNNYEEVKYIKYLHENRRRLITDPEEQVQSMTYLELIFDYNYPKEKIRMFVTVPMGVENKEADIVIYHDDRCTQSYIIIECKKEEVSEAEFQKASDQAFSYAHAIDGMIKFVWVTSGIRDDYFKVDKNSQVKETISDIPKYGSTKVDPYKYVKGGIGENNQKYSDIKPITEDELRKRFVQAHQALWGGGELNPSQAFDELDKLIFCKIWDEKNCKLGEPYAFQKYTPDTQKGDSDETILKKENKSITELAGRVLKLYELGRAEDPEVFKDDIRLIPARINTVVGYLQDVNLTETDLDSKGKAFETLMTSYFRGEFGQFFTPRKIVKFAVDVVPIEKKSFVLDTSCGSGGFLLYALDKVRKQADLVNTKGTPKHFDYWHSFAANNLFGIEINEQISRTAKMNMIIHDDGHTNVISADGLMSISDIQKINPRFEADKYNFIITNPPFGSLIKQTEKAYIDTYDFGKKELDWLDMRANPIEQQVRANQKTEVLFIEQAYNFLTDGGFLAIVLPDGILTNSSMQYIRDGIEEKFRIVSIVSLPQTAFAHTGAGVKSSILFLRKYSIKMVDKIRRAKQNLRDSIKTVNSFEKKFYDMRVKRYFSDTVI